jgi:hypothetical protein
MLGRADWVTQQELAGAPKRLTGKCENARTQSGDLVEGHIQRTILDIFK